MRNAIQHLDPFKRQDVNINDNNIYQAVWGL